MDIILPILYNAVYLGVTFDLIHYRYGYFNIYNEWNKTTKIEKENYISEYKVIETSREVRELYNVDSRLALALKLHKFENSLASVIKPSVFPRDKIVEIQIRVLYNKIEDTIPEYLKPNNDWIRPEYKYIETHFIKKIKRGGELRATMIFNCKSVEQKKKVMKSILNNIKKSGTFNETFIDKIESVKQELGRIYPGYSFREINCFGCLKVLRTNLKNVVKMGKELPEGVNINVEQNSFPLAMELEELATVYKDYPVYKENKEIIMKLDEVEEKFDDINIAREQMLEWDPLASLELNLKQQKMVQDYLKALEKARKAFVHALINLNISPSASPNQFDEAFQLYDSSNTSNHFQEKFYELKQKIEKGILQ